MIGYLKISSVVGFIELTGYGAGMADGAREVEAWNEEASALDQIYSVASTVSSPTTVAEIAAEAGVAETTARAHLDRLTEMSILLKHDRKDPTAFEPDPLYTRLQTIRDLLDEHDQEGLLDLRSDLEDEVAAWRDEYSVQSPKQLRERAADSPDSDTTRELRQAANQWDLVRYRLTIVEDAVTNYETYTHDGNSST